MSGNTPCTTPHGSLVVERVCGRWQAQFYPHAGRYLVSDNALEVHGTRSIGSFADEADAWRFADARNAWEATAPDPRDFAGCEPFPKPDRYDAGRAVFDSDPALRVAE